jgi:two-component system, cell cycle sensor histidine kinase and response regulator CckA
MTAPKSTSHLALETPLRVLLVEDNPRDARLMTTTLERAGCRLTLDQVDSPPEFQKCLENTQYDVIISDYNLPGWTAMEGLSLLRDSGRDIPFLVVSGSLGDEAAAECIKMGATDYVLKDRMARLPGAVTRALQEKDERVARRRAEEALRESEEKYRLLFESNPHAMWVFDRETLEFLEVNEAAVERYGYSRDEFLAMSIKDIRSPEDVPKLLDDLSQSPEGLTTTLRRHRTRSGEAIDVEITSDSLRFDGRAATLVLANDVTMRLRAEAELRSSEERFRLAFNASPEPMTISTLEEKRYLDVNSNFLKVTQYSRDEVIGRTATEIGFWQKPEERDAILSGVRAQGAYDVEISFGTKSGEVRAALLSVQHIEWAGQQCLLSVVKDVTERKDLEQQFRQAQKMEAVGQLAGGVAHDFNNLLMVINGYAQLVLEKLKPDDPLRKHVDEIKKAGDRASTLTRQLLAFSRRQILMPQVVDLNAVVAGMHGMLSRLIGENIELTVIAGPELGSVKVDPGQIEQVILNLAVNARDAMPQGGQLVLETQNVDLDESYTRNHAQMKPGRHVLLAVSDTGGGMDIEVQKHIFEPFFTTKPPGKGTGLGLSTAFGIVKQSEGSIWAYSEPGRGTTFKIYLPRIDKMAETLEPGQQLAEPALGGCTVLLVEDEASVRGLVRQNLNLMGCRVLEAQNGLEAIRIAEEHAGPIHALVTDAVMPGLNGQEVAERLAATRPDTKVLYMSGYTDDAVVRNALLGAHVAFIQKPFTSQALARKLSELLNPV